MTADPPSPPAKHATDPLVALEQSERTRAAHDPYVRRWNFQQAQAIQKVAKNRGFQLVFNLDAGQLAWADPSLDITPDVVKQLASQ